MTAPALSLQAVSKQYGASVALKPFDLTVAAGEFVTLLGPSGSGKSTLLGIAAGTLLPDSGRVLSHGKDVTHTPSHARNVGMVFQRYTLFPNMTVAQNVAFPLKVRKESPRIIAEKVAHYLALVGLAGLADRYPSQVSGGQAQRVALARALVFEPALLLMDEPLAAIDRRLRQMLQEEIRRIQRQTRVPTLYVTHDQDEAMHMSDRIVVIRDGAVAANDSPRSLYWTPPSVWAAEFLGDANVRTVQLRGPPRGRDCDLVDASGRHLSGVLHPAARAEGSLALIVRPEDCTVHPDQAAGTWPGRVADIAFRGAAQEAWITLEDGWTVRAQLHARHDIQPGASVYVGWPPAAAVIVNAAP